MTKIDIISGFLGAGKTTLIKKLIAEVFRGQQIVLIENEFGEIGIDGGFLKDAGINITEMNSGCICCSLVGDFGQALRKVEEQFHPDRILIEPSGVGKLSDVRRAVENVAKDVDMKVNSLTTVVDAKKVNMYMKNFGEFYNNQVESAGTIVLSRTQEISGDKLNEVVAMLKEKNPKAAFITTAWDQRMRNAAAIITTIMMKKNMTTSIMSTIMNTAKKSTLIIMNTMEKNMLIMSTMRRSMNTIITITIMTQTMYLRAGGPRLPASTRKRSWKVF